jgi:hypothetical protein
VTRPCDRVEAHRLGEDLVLGHHCTVEVHVLNPLAALVWDHARGGAGPARLARIVARTTGLAPEVAADHVRSALGRFRDLGLAGEHPARQAPPAPACEPLEHPGGPGGHGPLTALGYRFWIHPAVTELAPLAAEAAGAFGAPDGELPGHCGQDHRYDLHPAPGGTEVRADGIPLGTAYDALDARGLVRNHVHQAAVDHAGTMLVLHAAAVRQGDAVVALVGETGVGKSTLAASLAATGFEHAADELVALDGAGGTCIPVPALVNLKPGSRPLFPGVSDADGTDRWSVLYDPGRFGAGPWQPRQRRSPLAACVWSTHREGAALSVEALTPVEALAALVQHSFPTGRLPRLGPLVALVQWLPCWRLTHGDHCQAADAVAELLAQALAR